MVSGSNSIGVRLRESFFFPIFIAECSHRFLMVGLSSVEPPLEVNPTKRGSQIDSGAK